MKFIEKEMVNDFMCKIVSRILQPFGFNRLTYKVFSFFYGLGYKYSFGCIRFEENSDYLYMEFMPWYFGNKKMVKNNSYNKVMLYGAYDYLKMIDYFEKNCESDLMIKSHSNKEIAFLIHKKLGFRFKKYKNLKEAMLLSNSNNFELFITTKELISYKSKLESYVSILNNFENRN